MADRDSAEGAGSKECACGIERFVVRSELRLSALPIAPVAVCCVCERVCVGVGVRMCVCVCVCVPQQLSAPGVVGDPSSGGR